MSFYEIDSAGTGGWHIGSKPDRRMLKTAQLHGVSLDDIGARQFVKEDLKKYDLILAMDESNLASIKAHDRGNFYQEKIKLFRDFDPFPEDGNVPDPYYGGAAGFENVFDIVKRTCEQILNDLRGDRG